MFSLNGVALRPLEFYERYETMFKLPGETGQP
jgi:hypothetical protein